MRPEMRAAIRELAEERERLPGGAAPDLIAAKWELTPGETAALMSREERAMGEIKKASVLVFDHGGMSAIRAYEHIAEWCEEHAASAQREADAQTDHARMIYCEGQSAMARTLAMLLRKAAR